MYGDHFPDCLNSAKASCRACVQHTVTQLLLTEDPLPQTLMMLEINIHRVPQTAAMQHFIFTALTRITRRHHIPETSIL
jgi:hypothetical protein